MERHIPTRYEPLQRPMRGGMSRVYICKDTLLRRKVAIKFVDDPEDERRLLDEISALQNVRSKHVVQIYDVFRDESAPCYGIVLEYLEGPELSIAGAGEDSLARYVSILYQVASGLSDLHNQGVIHRDIKRDNIREDGSGIVKIFDFGLARFSEVNSETQGFAGTFGYAAPELYPGDARFTTAVDVYAFGILAWYLSGEDPPSSLAPVRQGNPPSFSSLALKIPPNICDLLDGALAIEPTARPSISLLRGALEAYLLKGSHKGLLVTSNSVRTIDASHASVRLVLSDKPGGNEWVIGIHYNGFAFVVKEVTADVLVNNRLVSAGETLPKSCVITLGGNGDKRAFATFDVSNPEVVL
ncbi:serine/threonine protein kinase [Synechococcus sp. HJ21-Hayes]|uniref:serine/threonine protein kinase n=1 Tax=Synechococcus sp. HJ21-Hayes TaxID=2823736 RepID=UPI0020CD6632|nr:serine/threonine-protein kinase [Synechococcus sp. HJ21-Hayes]MCP9852832.1 serine/threonine protein kinase [Synechococcus sp. HJ21-Hayes]